MNEFSFQDALGAFHHARNESGCVIQESAAWTTAFREEWCINLKEDAWTVTSVAVLMQRYRSPTMSGKLSHLLEVGTLTEVSNPQSDTYLEGRVGEANVYPYNKLVTTVALRNRDPTAKFNADSVQIFEFPCLPLWNNFAVWLRLLSMRGHSET